MKFIVLMLVGCLAGCAGAAKDVGPPPDVRAFVLANMARLFKDPDSIRDLAVGSAWREEPWGWRACVQGNARNSYGGYTGLQIYTLTIYDNGSMLMLESTIYTRCGQLTRI